MQTWFIVYFRLCCADKRAPIHPWHATDNACSSSTSWKASQVWRAFSLPPQGSVTVSFLLCSRLNKDVLQSCGPLSVVSCHMQNTTFEHTSWCSYENLKDHLEILEILWDFFFFRLQLHLPVHLYFAFTSSLGAVYNLENKSVIVINAYMIYDIILNCSNVWKAVHNIKTISHEDE